MRFFWGVRGDAVSAPEILLLGRCVNRFSRPRCSVNCSKAEGIREWIKTPKAISIVKKEANSMGRVVWSWTSITCPLWIFSVPVWSFLLVPVQYIQIASYRRIVVSKFGLRFQTLFALWSGLIQRLVCGGIRSVHENSKPTPANMCHWTAIQRRPRRRCPRRPKSVEVAE